MVPIPTNNVDEDDDDLLSLDLEDTENLKINKSQKNNDDIFKKPSFLVSENDDIIISTFNNNNNKDNKKNAISSEENDLLTQLFANEEEDAEDEFIASQSLMTSSTQLAKSSPNKELEICKEIPLVEIKEINLQNKVLMPPPSKKISPVKNSAKSKELLILEMAVENKSWTYSLSMLRKSFENFGLDTSLIKLYTLNYYYKKFFEYDLLMKPSDSSGVRKIPLLCVWIKEITRKPTSATVLLTDFSSDIVQKGTIMSSFLKEKANWEYLMIGTVLFIKDVYLLQVNHNKNCYHLNINRSNIVNIYYPDLEEINNSGIKTKTLQNFDGNRIKELIDEFETNYTNYEYKPPVNETLNKSNNSRKSLDKKSAPYQVPAHLNKNHSNQNNNSSMKSFASNRNSAPQNSTINKNNNANLIQNPKSQNLNNSNRNFQFNSTSKNIQNDDQNSIKNHSIIENIPEFTQASNKNMSQFNSSIVSNSHNNQSICLASSSTQKTQNSALSEDIFSQLIFGCGDELFNDDD